MVRAAPLPYPDRSRRPDRDRAAALPELEGPPRKGRAPPSSQIARVCLSASAASAKALDGAMPFAESRLGLSERESRLLQDNERCVSL